MTPQPLRSSSTPCKPTLNAEVISRAEGLEQTGCLAVRHGFQRLGARQRLAPSTPRHPHRSVSCSAAFDGGRRIRYGLEVQTLSLGAKRKLNTEGAACMQQTGITGSLNCPIVAGGDPEVRGVRPNAWFESDFVVSRTYFEHVHVGVPLQPFYCIRHRRFRETDCSHLLFRHRQAADCSTHTTASLFLQIENSGAEAKAPIDPCA
jgi:hypothetical protein